MPVSRNLVFIAKLVQVFFMILFSEISGYVWPSFTIRQLMNGMAELLRYILICTHFPCLKRTVAKINREI